MKRKSKKKSIPIMKGFTILLVLIASATLFLGVGYAQISGIALNIEGTATADGQTGIATTTVRFTNSNSSTSYAEITSYYQTMISSRVVLDNSPSAYATIEVQITNLTGDTYFFDNLLYDTSVPGFYSNSNILPSLSGITPNGTLLMPQGENDSSLIFYITYQYADGSNITNNVLNNVINYHFTEARVVTFEDCTNAAGQSSQYIRSESFNNGNGANYVPTIQLATTPSSVEIKSADGNTTLIENTDYTYSNGVITFITPINTNINVKAISSTIPDVGIYEPDSPEEGTNYYGGSPGKPTVTATNGVVTYYESSEAIDTNTDIVDTGFMAFTDSRNFEMHIKADFPESNQTNNSVLVDVRDRTTGSTNKNNLQIAYSRRTSPPVAIINSGGTTYPINLLNEEIDITVTYINGVLTIINNNDGTTVYNNTVTISVEGMSVLLGYTLSNGSVVRQADALIKEFYIVEI